MVCYNSAVYVMKELSPNPGIYSQLMSLVMTLTRRKRVRQADEDHQSNQLPKVAELIFCSAGGAPA